MTQTQQRKFAYIFATLSVITSIACWTMFLACTTKESVKIPLQAGQGTMHQQDASIIEVQHQDIPLHGAAEAQEQVEIVELEASVLQRSTNTPIEPIAPELLDWSLNHVYQLEIPKIGVETPVLLPDSTYWEKHAWGLLEEQMQVGLSHGAVAYPHSSRPGSNGSLIIAGHSSPPDERAINSDFGSIFKDLPELEAGDEIRVIRNGRPVIYAVERIEVVPVHATEILKQQSEESLLKIITCFPIGTTKERMVVTAKRVGLRNM